MERTRKGTTQRIDANRTPKKNKIPSAVAQAIKGQIQAVIANTIYKQTDVHLTVLSHDTNMGTGKFLFPVVSTLYPLF